MAPEQPLVLTPLRPRDQRRHQTLPLPLSWPSLQPQVQSSHQPLPIVPEQRPLLARPLRPDQAPALASLKPSLRPPPQPQDQPLPLCLLLTLAQAPFLLRHPELLLLLSLQQLLPQPRLRTAQSAVKTLQLGKAVSCRLKAVGSLAPPLQPPLMLLQRHPALRQFLFSIAPPSASLA